MSTSLQPPIGSHAADYVLAATGETGIYPPQGEPRTWVVEHKRAKTVKVFTGPSALRDAERYLDRQPEDKVLSGFYGLDYGEYRRCCHAYLSPEAECGC